MANSLNIDLTDKTVILSLKYYKGTEEERKFICKGGFGCKSFTMGSAVIGKFVNNGEECRIEGYEIEKLA